VRHIETGSPIRRHFDEGKPLGTAMHKGDGRKIRPIEVKSSDHSNHASMDYFMSEHSKSLGQPYIIYS
jgi:hypothetical protein